MAPSGHIRNGAIAPGLTLQILDRFSWEGNAYIDRPEWERCGLAVDLYDDMLRAFHEQITAEQAPEHYTATRVYRPTGTATLAETRAAVLTSIPLTARAEVIACVPNRWGMVASTGTHMNQAMERTHQLVDILTAAGLARKTDG
ncbi:hypothetical protein ACWGCP_30970 [Streptomyces niveus]